MISFLQPFVLTVPIDRKSLIVDPKGSILAYHASLNFILVVSTQFSL